MVSHGEAKLVESQDATLSIVIPLFDEEGNVSVLLDRLSDVLAKLPERSEIIFVDDGSRDGTWAEIVAASKRQDRVRGIRLSRNFGHQPALLAGLFEARGRAVISMDGDLQHPPEVIPELVAAWRAGYEVVATERLDRHVASSFKRATSLMFYRVFSSLSGVPLNEGASDFRLLDRRVLDQIIRLPTNELFLRGIVQWVGFRRTTIAFEAAKRHSGTTKYSLSKMVRFALSGIVSFSTIPLRLGIWIGAIISVFSFGYLVFAVIQYYQGQTLPGWASTIGALLFLFGVHFILLGLIGLYIARIHGALTGRPAFIIAQRHNSAEASQTDFQPSTRPQPSLPASSS